MQPYGINYYLEDIKKELSEPVGTLQICGGSQFTRALARRCEAWNIPYAFVDETDSGYPVVVDTEVKGGNHAGDDIDRGYPMSACAEAIATYLPPRMIYGRQICIIGRGKAVQGLRDHLESIGGTVIVCHSKTSPHLLYDIAVKSSIVVNAAPSAWKDIRVSDSAFAIDVTGEAEKLVSGINAPGIGLLTCAILARRASEWRP